MPRLVSDTPKPRWCCAAGCCTSIDPSGTAAAPVTVLIRGTKCNGAAAVPDALAAGPPWMEVRYCGAPAGPGGKVQMEASDGPAAAAAEELDATGSIQKAPPPPLVGAGAAATAHIAAGITLDARSSPACCCCCCFAAIAAAEEVEAASGLCCAAAD